MGKWIALAAVVIAIVVGYSMFSGSTPEEVGQAATDTATSTAEQVGQAATDAATTVADAAGTMANDASDALKGLMDGAGLSSLTETFKGLNLDGFDAAQLDPANFDLNKLLESLGVAGLGEEASASLKSALETASATPELLSELLGQIKTALGL